MLSTIKKKLFSINAGASTPALPYKVYTALLTQSGESSPSVTILQNTLGDIEWTYYGEGTYIGQLIEGFVENKTFPIYGQTNTNVAITKIYRADSDSVWIEVFSSPNVYSDNVLNNTPIEIRVYN